MIVFRAESRTDNQLRRVMLLSYSILLGVTRGGGGGGCEEH